MLVTLNLIIAICFYLYCPDKTERIKMKITHHYKSLLSAIISVALFIRQRHMQIFLMVAKFSLMALSLMMPPNGPGRLVHRTRLGLWILPMHVQRTGNWFLI